MAVENFLINTDYPMDKVFGWWEGSFIATARYGLYDPRRSTTSINHGVSDYAMPVGSWSTDNITWYPFGVSPADVSSGSPVFQTIECSAYCTTSELVIAVTNWTGSNATVYYAVQLIARE